jgi:general stress protein 26
MTNTTKRIDQGDRDELIAALDDFQHAMLITMGSDGLPRARPMALLETSPDGELWFVSREDSSKIDEIAHSRGVCVTFQSRTEFISLSGLARLTTDHERAREHWGPFLAPWFPEGPEAPDLLLIHFVPQAGELWKTDARAVRSFLTKAARALDRGESVEPPQTGHTSASLP